MKKFRLQVLLMIITILGVTGFQLFWLRQTYIQEKKALAIKTDFAFRDVTQQLQVFKLRIDSGSGNTSKFKIKIVGNDEFDEELNVHLKEKKEILSTINVIRRRVADSFIKVPGIKKEIYITNRDRKIRLTDTMPGYDEKPRQNELLSVLYRVDSLQDSLKISEIHKALTSRLEKEQIRVPFNIQRLDSFYHPGETRLNEVTVGFANPTTYRLELRDTFPFLIKRISFPILFSALLLAITIISFLLLYRNLLQQKRLTSIKNEFIGNITHELKTPIATISVAIEAMKDFNALQSSERTAEYLDISVNELKRLSLLVDKVLSLSKFEKREIEIKKESFDLSQLMQEVIDSMKLQFEKQDAHIALQTTGTNFMIEADKKHISSVIYNLLDNALKYSKEKPVINVHVLDQEKYLEVRVTDNGIGIAGEYTSKIFEQFFRVPSGDKHNIKGHGLGLSYVSHILKSHQGFIEVESELGKGSTFIVKLPFAEAPVIYYDRKRRILKKHFKL